MNLTIGCPPGVGEAWWTNSKLKALKEHHKADKLTVCVFGGAFNRAGETHERFPWVDEVRFVTFPMQPANKKVSDKGTYEYLPITRNFKAHDGTVFDYLLIPNQHLEEGHRIEDWFTDVQCNNETLGDEFVFTEGDHEVANRIVTSVGHPFVVMYLGPLGGNNQGSHNKGGVWTMQQWNILIRAVYKQWGLHTVVVGHPDHDLSYFKQVEPLLNGCNFVHNHIGSTADVPQVFALTKQSEMVISFQCGLPIGTVYLGVPTVMFWRPHGSTPWHSISPQLQVSVFEDMSTCWAPKRALKHGTYLPQFYTRCSPSTIMTDIKNNGWID